MGADPGDRAGTMSWKGSLNIWNRVVIDRMNVRVAVGESVEKINRELARKFEEFGYLKDGTMVKEYIVPTDANIARWVKGRDYDE